MLLAIWALLLAVLFGEVTGTQALFEIGRFNLNAIDPAFPLCCFAAVRCWIDTPPNRNLATVSALILAALVVVNLVRGLEQSLFAGFSWLRTAGFLAPLLVIGTTLRPSPAIFAAMRKAIITVGLLLAILVLARVAISPTLFFTVAIDGPNTINDGGRPIANPGAMILVMGLILSLSAVLRPVRSAQAADMLIVALLVIGLVLSEQVTAIVATAAAALALIVLERPFSDRSVGGLGVTAIIAFCYLSFAGWADLLPASTRQYIHHRTDNLGTRTAIWQSFSAKFPSLPLIDKLIGLPAGSDPALFVVTSGHWRLWDRSLHSMYVGIASAFGLVGLFAYLAFLLASLVIAASLARTQVRIGLVTPALAIAFLTLAAIEGFSYDLEQDRLLPLLPPLLLVAQARWRRPGPSPASQGGLDRAARV